jgi:flagellar FliL protein
MADTDTSKTQSRAESEAAIRAMRAGEGADGDKPAKKGRKKLFLVLLVVLLAAGGGAAYKFLLAKDDSTLAEAPEPEPEVIEPVELVYIDLDPLFIPFRTSGGQRHKIVVVLSLEVGRKDNGDKCVWALLLRLRESYVRALTSRPFPGAEEGSIKTIYLKNRIRAENNRILGTGVVSDVLVRDIRVLPG